MIARGIFGTLAPFGCCVLLAASCSLPRTPVQPGISRPRTVEAAQLAQLDAGHQAVFARCIPPACPTRTPKTLSPGKSVSPDPAAKTAVPMVKSSRTVIVQFAPGSARLNSAGRLSLDAAASDLLSAHRIKIIGRTDSTGEKAPNENLASARASRVRDYLRKTHPALTAALTLKAQGTCCFIAPNDTASGRAKNRRVEVIVQTNEADRT